MNSSIPKAKQKQYADYVKQITPTHSLPMNMAKAFLTGGVICVVGQIITNFAKSRGLDQDMAGTWCSVTLVFISVILTGFNIYPKIGKFGGAGSLVPITGFANSVAAPAIEYKTEGQVFGIGCKIFTIAGPVILYGIMSSWIAGVIYYLLKIMEVNFMNPPDTSQTYRFCQYELSESGLRCKLCFCSWKKGRGRTSWKQI